MSYAFKDTQQKGFLQAFYSITNPTAFKVLNFFVKSSRKYKKLFFSRETIGVSVGLESEKQVTRLTNDLQDLGMLTKFVYKDTGTCCYVLNPLLFELWINFYRQIPALSIMFITQRKPVPINNVPQYKKDKGISSGIFGWTPMFSALPIALAYGQWACGIGDDLREQPSSTFLKKRGGGEQWTAASSTDSGEPPFGGCSFSTSSNQIYLEGIGEMVDLEGDSLWEELCW